MIKNIFASQLRLNMLSGVTATIINLIVMAAGYPIYLHFLGYEKYGVWLVMTTVLSFALLGNFGIGQALVKLVAEDYGRGDIEGVRRYTLMAIILLCISGAAVLTTVLLLKHQIISAFNLKDENAQIALWLLPYIGILSVYVFIVSVFSGVLSGLGRMDLANYAQSFARVIAILTATVLLFKGWGIKSLIIATTVSCVVNHFVYLFYINRIIKLRPLRMGSMDIPRCCKLLRFGSGVLGSMLLDMLISPFNKLILSRYVGVSSIPVYDIAYTGSMQFRSFIEVSFRAFVPEVSRLAGNMTRQAKDRILHLFRRAIKLVFACSIPLYGGTILLLAVILKLWLRQAYNEQLLSPFRILLISSFVSLIGVPADNILLGLGMVRKTFTSRAILSSTSSLIISIMIVSNINISVEKISLCILVATIFSSAYLNWQNRRVIFKLREG